MELLINLIILFVIFFTVFKRIQEISKKKDEIKLPPAPQNGPPSKPETTTDVFKELGRRIEQVVEVDSETVKPSGEQVHPYGYRIEKMQQEFAEPVPIELPEIFPDAEVYPQVEEPVPEIIEQYDYNKVNAYKKGKKRYALQFRGTEIVRGILMSEILGTPVSMRTE